MIFTVLGERCCTDCSDKERQQATRWCPAYDTCPGERGDCPHLGLYDEMRELAGQVAAILARIPDTERRDELAHYVADSIANAYPDGWFYDRNFFAACGVKERRAA